jgi:transcriptional regulator GlxA family with amidase domain
VADRLYISQRQLERLYKIHVGISPKKYARLLRVEQARIAIKNAPTLSAAEIGNATGFYDQAHFIREFKSIIGMTPNDYAVRSIQRQSVTT